MNTLVYIVSQADHSSRFCKKCTGTLSKQSLIFKGFYLICFQVITLRHRLITSGQETDVVTKVICIQMNILFFVSAIS